MQDIGKDGIIALGGFIDRPLTRLRIFLRVSDGDYGLAVTRKRLCSAMSAAIHYWLSECLTVPISRQS